MAVIIPVTIQPECLSRKALNFSEVIPLMALPAQGSDRSLAALVDLVSPPGQLVLVLRRLVGVPPHVAGAGPEGLGEADLARVGCALCLDCVAFLVLQREGDVGVQLGDPG